jgi:hypothetical protein
MSGHHLSFLRKRKIRPKANKVKKKPVVSSFVSSFVLPAIKTYGVI